MIQFAFVLFSYFSWAKFLAHKINPLKWGSWWLILLYCSILLSVQFLGSMQQLTANNLVIIGGIFLIIQAFFSIIDRNKKNPIELNLQSGSNFKTILLLILIAFFVGTITFYNLAFPLAEIDSMAYHLPILHQLITTHSVWDIFYAAFVGPNTFFPANHEALQSFITIFTGSINFNFIITLSGIGLFFTALKDLATKKPIQNYLILLTILSAAGVPFLFKQLLNFQIDLFMFCLFGSAVSWLISSLINNEKQDLAKAFLATGFLIGTKYNGLPETIILTPIFIWAFIKFRHDWKKILTYPLLTIMTGGFWYLRNAIVTQNPLYPFSLNFGPIHLEGYKKFSEDLINTSILERIPQMGIRNMFFTISNNHEFNQFIGEYGLWIFPAIIGLSLITILILTYQKIRNRNKNGFNIAILIALLFTMIGETFYYLNSPYTFTLWNQTVRYSATIYALIPIISICLIYFYEKFRWPIIAVLSTFLIYNFQKSFLIDPQYLNLLKTKTGLISQAQIIILVIISTITVTTFFWFLKNKHPKKLFLNLSIGILSSIIISAYIFSSLPIIPNTTATDNIFIAKQHGELNQLIPFIIKLRGTPHTRDQKIAVAGITAYWPFLEAGYKAQYINIDGCETCTYPDYANRSIREKPNEQAWLHTIKKLQIKYLLVSGNFSLTGPIYEKTWAEKNSTSLTKIMEQNNITLYQIQ